MTVSVRVIHRLDIIRDRLHREGGRYYSYNEVIDHLADQVLRRKT